MALPLCLETAVISCDWQMNTLAYVLQDYRHVYLFLSVYGVSRKLISDIGILEIV